MLTLSMSALRGKADIPEFARQCPLMTLSGHSHTNVANTLEPSLTHWPGWPGLASVSSSRDL